MSPRDTDDLVADLYDGFLRRIDTPDVAAQVARDLDQRLEEWQPHRIAAERVRRGGVLRVVLAPRSRREWRFSAGFWCVVVCIVAASFPFGYTGVFCGVSLAAALLVGLSLLWMSGLDVAGIKAPTDRCPMCGYALAGLTPAIDPGRTNGLTVGPARCPECGERWPQVPRRPPA